MNRQFVVAVFVAIALGACSSRLKNPGRLDELLDGYVAEGRVAGVVALVLRDGKPLYERAAGWRDRELRSPMTMDTLFRVASQTKAITSAAALMLVEEKKLSLNDPVAKFVPAFARAQVAVRDGSGAMHLVPAAKQITIHHLLTHTSGISYGIESEVADYYRDAGLGPSLDIPWNLSGIAATVCEVSQQIARLPLVAQPGSGWVYGYSTDVLGCVVEKVSGLKLDDFIGRRILGPLQMRDTTFFPGSKAAPRLAAVYGDQNRRLERLPGAGLQGPRRLVSGGAGLISTATDYAVFLELIRLGGAVRVGDKEIRLLNPESVRLMTTSRIVPEGGLGFGYGFETTEAAGARGLESAGSFGWSGAYGTAYRVDPKRRLTIVFMTQLYPNKPGLREKFWQTLYEVLAN